MAISETHVRYCFVLIFLTGCIEIIVATYAIEAKYSPGVTMRSLVGDGPKFGIAAGVILVVTAVASYFVKFGNKTHLYTVILLLITALTLLITATCLAIESSHEFKRIIFKSSNQRLEVVIGVSIASAIINLLGILQISFGILVNIGTQAKNLSEVSSREVAKHSPTYSIAAGAAAVISSIATYYTDLNRKVHLLLILIFASTGFCLSIVTMIKASDDSNQLISIDTILRLKVIVGISGMATLVLVFGIMLVVLGYYRTVINKSLDMLET